MHSTLRSLLRSGIPYLVLREHLIMEGQRAVLLDSAPAHPDDIARARRLFAPGQGVSSKGGKPGEGGQR